MGLGGIAFGFFFFKLGMRYPDLVRAVGLNKLTRRQALILHAVISLLVVVGSAVFVVLALVIGISK